MKTPLSIQYNEKESPTCYTAPAIFLHWLGAVLIVAGFILGLIMTDIPGLTPTKLKYFSWHKWIGVTAFLSVVPRIVWRLTHTVPALPKEMGRMHQYAAHLAHLALYGLLIAVPISGLLYSQAAGVAVVYFGVINIPTVLAPDPQWKVILKTVHWILNYLLFSLVALHVLAALKHQFIQRDNLLARMLPFLQRNP
ncbi:cytochrome b [Undibacterium sp. SXout7W]|uniref:cytochrome b n=1 Tax=Undibacterium sp. SXout7W TaxID=3413049 RepID=UPI003BF2C9D5